MKIQSIVFLTLVSLTTAFGQAHAASDVYCKVNGKAVSATSEEGDYCTQSFAFGEVCFFGARDAVIDMIDNGDFNWDEEWIEDGKFVGRDLIAYTYVDGPNEMRKKYIMERCPRDFFRR